MEASGFDMAWSAPTWWIFLALALGAGSGLLSYYGMHIAESRRASKTFNRWLDEGRALCFRVIDTEAAAAEAKRELFEWIGALPKDFNPTVFLSVDLARGLQQAVLYEAEQQGLVQPGTLERVFGIRIPTPAAPGASLSLPPPAPAAAALEEPARAPAGVHDIGAWIARARSSSVA